MLALWFGLVGLSASPELHRILHADSANLSHECVITLFASGRLLVSSAWVAVTAAVFVCFGLPWRAQSVLYLVSDVRLAASRAPPSRSSLQ